MSYQVVVTFDLVDASSDQYACVREALSDMGLYNFVITREDETRDLPRNTFTGDLYGSEASEIRDSVRSRLRDAFGCCGVRGPLWVAVGGEEHTWGGHGLTST